jgi:NarL family two-component system response regulator LiaR
MTPAESSGLHLDGRSRRPDGRYSPARNTQEEIVAHTRPIRVFVADTHPLVRRGLTYLINARPDLELAGKAKNSDEAIQGVRQCRPDLILFDLGLACNDLTVAIKAINAEDPALPLLVIAGFSEEERIYLALKAGASGHLFRDASPATLVDAIHQAHRGESSLHPTMARRLLAELREPSSLPLAEEPLSRREGGIVRLAAHGLSNQAIAERVGCSEATLRRHIRGILDKLHNATRSGSVLYEA